MAKFILVPTGYCRPDTGKTERTYILVNLDQIIKITPDPNSQFASRIILRGSGGVICAYRRFDTLMSQVTGKMDAFELNENEEANAAYEAGYNKAKEESSTSDKAIAKKLNKARFEFVQKAIHWIEHNPLGKGWRNAFQLAMKDEELPEDDDIIELNG